MNLLCTKDKKPVPCEKQKAKKKKKKNHILCYSKATSFVVFIMWPRPPQVLSLKNSHFTISCQHGVLGKGSVFQGYAHQCPFLAFV